MLATPNFSQEIKQVVIKSDSAYLVNSMVTHVEKWRLNNYTSSRDRPVVNADLLRGLDECVVWLEERAWTCASGMCHADRTSRQTSWPTRLLTGWTTSSSVEMIFLTEGEFGETFRRSMIREDW
jgi:hypothetical protein